MTVVSLEDVEKEAILNAIMECGGVCPAARALGVSKSCLYDKMRRYGIKIKANAIIRALKSQKPLPLIPDSKQ